MYEVIVNSITKKINMKSGGFSMLKKMAFFVVLLFIVVQLSFAFSAAEITVFKSKPVLDGVLSENEWPAEGKYVLNKAAVDAYDGLWSGTMTDDMSATYYFTWDENGLYAAADIKDKSLVYAKSWDVHGNDDGPAADGFQINLFAHTLARWVTIGSYEDGKLAPRTHYGDVADLDGIVTGKAIRNENSFVIECFIPWTALEPDEEIEEGSKIPFIVTYMDRFDGGENCYKSMHKDSWPPNEELIDNFLVLSKVYDPPVVEVPKEKAPKNPVTSDFSFVMYSVLALASAAGVFASKKR